MAHLGYFAKVRLPGETQTLEIRMQIDITDSWRSWVEHVLLSLLLVVRQKRLCGIIKSCFTSTW